MPVGDEDVPFAKIRHEVGRHQIADAIDAGLAALGLQLLEPITDRHVGADDQDGVGESAISSVGDLVEDTPCGEARHDGRLPGPRRHLAGVADKRAGLLTRDGHALPEVVAGLDKKDHGLDVLALTEEEAALAIQAVPVRQQLGRDTGRARIASLTPGLHPLPDLVDERQRDARADVIRFCSSCRAPGRAIVVTRLAALLDFLRRPALLDQPVLRRLRVGVADDRLEDFVELAHARYRSGSASFSPLTTMSSFPRSSMTFTAIFSRSPAENGSLTVPARCSQTDSS